MSCKDVADMWIHEAFPVYSERINMMNLLGAEGEQDFMEHVIAS